MEKKKNCQSVGGYPAKKKGPAGVKVLPNGGKKQAWVEEKKGHPGGPEDRVPHC